MPKHRLRALMWENGDTIRDIAQYLHITAESMSRKLAGKSEFKEREIKALIIKYDLTPEQTWEVFFDLSPKKDTT